MLEGLWVIRFGGPGYENYELNGGVVVIESGRLLGGDSGYFYLGETSPAGPGNWNVKVAITRHDPTIESVFGDADQFQISGKMHSPSKDALGRPMLIGSFPGPDGNTLDVQMLKVSELP